MPIRPNERSNPLDTALRAYLLGISFSSIPSLLPAFASYLLTRKATAGRRVLRIAAIQFGPFGLASALAVAAGAGNLIESLLESTASGYNSKPTESADARKKRKAFISNEALRTFTSYLLSSWLAISLLHAKSRRRSPASSTSRFPLTFPVHSHASSGQASSTLDLTLLFAVRALDAAAGAVLSRYSSTTATDEEGGRKRVQNLRQHLDAVIFWLSCSRIMWCFFFEPSRLPKSYNKWIGSLAEVDPRILEALRAIRAGTWAYGQKSTAHPNLLSSLSEDLGHSAKWGLPELLPSMGGSSATRQFKELGVRNRQGLGGIPCQLLHWNGGESCLANTANRGFRAFCKAFLIYLPVHVLPALVFRPHMFIRSPLQVPISTCRSSAFLAAFVSSIWLSVCMTRTLMLARLFPFVSHNFWDGPYGCIMAGSVVCGSSIYIEKGRRRAEIALYVLPRALRASMKESWIRRNPSSQVYERAFFACSLAYMMTASIHAPVQLRGLSSWALQFVTNGPGYKSTVKRLLNK